MKRIVYYHAHCADGFAAAWLLKRTWEGSHVETYYVPIKYGDSLSSPGLPKITRNVHVYFLDFCPTLKQLQYVYTNAGSLHVLDHHASQEDTLSRFAHKHIKEFENWEKRPAFDGGGWRVSGLTADVPVHLEYAGTISGAELTRLWLGLDSVPLISYVQDRDLWRWELPHSERINAYIQAHPFDFAVWNRLHRELLLAFDTCVAKGEAVLLHQDKLASTLANAAVLRKLPGGWTIPVACAPVLQSEVGHELLVRHWTSPFSASYMDVLSSGSPQYHRVWSLRSRKGESVDVSELAKTLGGGGHKHAAGFTIYCNGDLEFPCERRTTEWLENLNI